MAVGAIAAIQDMGLNVPNDIAVVGYDNRDFARILRPKRKGGGQGETARRRVG